MATHLLDYQTEIIKSYIQSKVAYSTPSDGGADGKTDTRKVKLLKGWSDVAIRDLVNKERNWFITETQVRNIRLKEFGRHRIEGPRGPRKKEVPVVVPQPELALAEPQRPMWEVTAPPPSPPPPQDWAALLIMQEEMLAVKGELLETKAEMMTLRRENAALSERVDVITERQAVQTMEIYDVTEYLTSQNAKWRRV